MKINKVIETVNSLKINSVDDEIKFGWINELEGKIFNNIINKAADNSATFTGYNYDSDLEHELFTPFPYDDIYFDYISAMVDYTEGELGSYNNNMTLYNSKYDDFAAWYRRNHVPKRGY